MSKSEGNFYTLRDLLEKGHKPSTLRYLLASVPYGKPLNFTDAGLEQAAQSVRRGRGFKAPAEMGQPKPRQKEKKQTTAAPNPPQRRAPPGNELKTAPRP